VVDPPPNNGMHPTRDTTALIYLHWAGGRVMRGVRLLLSYSPLLIECVAEADGEAVCSKHHRPWRAA